MRSIIATLACLIPTFALAQSPTLGDVVTQFGGGGYENATEKVTLSPFTKNNTFDAIYGSASNTDVELNTDFPEDGCITCNDVEKNHADGLSIQDIIDVNSTSGDPINGDPGTQVCTQRSTQLDEDKESKCPQESSDSAAEDSAAEDCAAEDCAAEDCAAEDCAAEDSTEKVEKTQ